MMNTQLITTIIAKDLSLYFRNRFFGFVTILGLVAYAGMYYLLPSSVDETLTVGFYAPSMPSAIVEPLAEAGVVLETAVSEEAMLVAMGNGDYNVGVVVPDELLPNLAAGIKDDIIIYFTPDFPAELQEAYAILFQELAFSIVGQELNIEATEEVIGIDMVGQQIPLRKQMVPMLVVAILMLETMGMAALISSEIEMRTIQALLVTPLSIGGLFTGKGLFGVTFAFVQVTLLMLATRSLSHEPLLLLFTLLLGSMLVTGLGFLIASVARDLMGVMGWGMLAIIILAIPSFTVIIPGLVTNWVKLIPSYYVVDTLYRVMNLGAGWADVSSNLLALLAFALLFFVLGVWALQRKFV
ncbi:MAG: ABC transporter permease [Chloroflexi bacterium]|nr:ABC transporter permease [Chloroflexota bacterium]